MDTNIKKAELLDIMRVNREKHWEVFRASLDGYRAQAELILGQHLASILEGRTPEIRILLSRPQDHTRDYDRVVRMLELDTREELLLDERTFAQYVMDDWQWKRDWLTMSSRYAADATVAAYGVSADEDYDI